MPSSMAVAMSFKTGFLTILMRFAEMPFFKPERIGSLKMMESPDIEEEEKSFSVNSAGPDSVACNPTGAKRESAMQ